MVKMRRTRGGEAELVHRVTSAQESLSDEQARRTRRYLWSMGIRTTCFLLAVFTPGPIRWVFLAGAVVLPYIAVVAANAGRESGDPSRFAEVDARQDRALESRPRPAP